MIAIDVGNTKVAVALFKDERLRRVWRSGTYARFTTEDYRNAIGAYLTSEGETFRSAGPMILASVVPAVTDQLRRLGDETDLHVVDHRSPLSFEIAIPEPESLGADRIGEMEGAIQKYGEPLVVIGFGTATTLAAIDRNRRFLGGTISPGLGVSLQALYSSAALLSPKPLETPSHALGNSTDSAIASGVYLGHAAMVAGLLRKVKEEIGEPELTVIATGGAADVVAPHLGVPAILDPTLSLEGLHSIHRNLSHPRRAHA